MSVAKKGFQIQLELMILTESFNWDSFGFIIRTVEKNMLDGDRTVVASRASGPWCFCYQICMFEISVSDPESSVDFFLVFVNFGWKFHNVQFLDGFL